GHWAVRGSFRRSLGIRLSRALMHQIAQRQPTTVRTGHCHRFKFVESDAITLSWPSPTRLLHQLAKIRRACLFPSSAVEELTRGSNLPRCHPLFSLPASTPGCSDNYTCC